MENKKFTTMVICSTLNQMVNYIAIMKHGIEKVINITVEKGQNDNLNSKFPYVKWDKNLLTLLADYKITIEDSIKFSSNELISHEQIVDKLKIKIDNSPLKDESILWNITGGQRHFVMAITDYVNNFRQNDYLVYYEGDYERFYYYNSKHFLQDVDVKEKRFDMTIPIALKLMGFKTGKDLGNSSRYYKFLIAKNKKEYVENNGKDSDYDTVETEYTYYNELYDLYIENVNFVKTLIASNRFQCKNSDNKNNLNLLIEDIKKLQDDKMPKTKNLFEGDNLDILEKSLGDNKNGKVFGYILERMAFYRMIDIIKKDENLVDKIADINMNIKIKSDERDADCNLDEFDILLLTKTGKLIVFECKSGKMIGDNAKSTNYSTYKIAGIYGTPVLIDPLTDQCDTDEDNTFKNIKSAERAASRADMAICRIKNRNKKDNNIYDLEYYIQEIIGG